MVLVDAMLNPAVDDKELFFSIKIEIDGSIHDKINTDYFQKAPIKRSIEARRAYGTYVPIKAPESVGSATSERQSSSSWPQESQTHRM